MPITHDTTMVGDPDAPARVRVSPMKLERGTQLGRYVVLEQLGRGGMGVVLAAFDPQLDRKVALKLLHAYEGGGSETTGGAPRLLREAQALAKLSHPNVVTIHDVGTVGGAVFLAMEFIDGQTLGDWAGRADSSSPRSWREIITMYIAAGRGIAAAHRAGIVHRDFKPENVMIDREGRPRVLDFGLARATELTPGRPEPHAGEVRPESDHVAALSSSSLDAKLTVTGTLMGTPAYMAPEQHLGKEVDERSDQFSFCVSVYEAVYGERPFAGDSLAALSFAVSHGTIRDAPAGTAVPSWVRRVLLRGLAVDPTARYPDMDELLRELGRDPARTRRMALVGGGLLLGVIGLFALVQHQLAGPPLCSDAATHLDGVWDDEARAEVRASFRGSGAVYAEDALRGVESTLDAYTDEWVAMHGDACAATRVRGEQSDELLTLRMACLDRSRTQLDVLVDVYRSADAKTVERGVEAAESLPPLRLCADVEALTLGVRPPATDALARRVEELRADVDAARSLARAGHQLDARERMTTIMSEVEATEYRPLIAEAELARGASLEAAEERLAALERAVWMAEVSRHDRIAAEAWVMLVRVRGLDMNAFASALDAAVRADAAIERIGGDAELRIQLDVAKGSVLNAMDREDEALVHHRRARAARIAAGQAGTPTALNEVVSLANVLLDHDATAEADTLLSDAVVEAERQLGPEHPWVARLRGTLSRVQYRQTHYADAEASARAALRVFERTNGKDSPQVGTILNGLAIILDDQRRFDEALPIYQRAHANFLANLGPRHLNTGKALHNMGVLELETGHYEQALAYLQQAGVIKKHVFGDESDGATEVAWTEVHTGEALLALGRVDEAFEVFAGARRRLEIGGPTQHNSTVWVLDDLARAELARGRVTEARRILEFGKSRTGAETTVSPSTLGRYWFTFARVMAAMGERELATEYAERSIARFVGASMYYSVGAIPVREWLASQP